MQRRFGVCISIDNVLNVRAFISQICTYIHRCFKANQKSSCSSNRVHTAHHIECWITYFVCCSKNSGKLLNLCVCFMHFDSMRSRCAHISKFFIYKHSPAHKRTQNPFVQKNGRNGGSAKRYYKTYCLHANVNGRWRRP